MDPDITLLNLLNLFLPDMNDAHAPPTADEVSAATEALTQWHYNRGCLPQWPAHLVSGQNFWRLPVGTLSSAECIALLTRVQVSIESENRSVYVEAVRRLGAWAKRALDSA